LGSSTLVVAVLISIGPDHLHRSRELSPEEEGHGDQHGDDGLDDEAA
jgi:hypothetical protein